MSNKPHLLDELKAVLEPHTRTTGETIEQFFNRQLHERIVDHRLDQPLPNVRLLQLSDAEVNILEELWSTAQLKGFPLWHKKIRPAKTDVPLVVFRGWGKLCLIDGQTRVNLWSAVGNNESHRVLIVEPQSTIIDPFGTAANRR